MLEVQVRKVPVAKENEAAKDLEARYAKFCAWLDEIGAEDIDFSLGTQTVEFKHKALFDAQSHMVVTGEYVIYRVGDDGGIRIYWMSEERFKEHKLYV